MTPGKWISLVFFFLLAPVATAEDIVSLRVEIEAETKCFASPGPEKAAPPRPLRLAPGDSLH